MNSLFYVLRGLVELSNLDVFASDPIKNRRYQTKCFPGNMMYGHISTKYVGNIDTLRGSMQNITCNLFFWKDPYYTMNIMYTYCGFLVPLDPKYPTRVWQDTNISYYKNKTFKYHDTFANNFLCRKKIDSHNNIRHDYPYTQ